MIADLLYAYASPIILLGRLSWSSVKSAVRRFPIFGAFLTSQGNVASNIKQKDPEPTEADQRNTWQLIFRPLLHFPVLWCLLIAISNERTIQAVALLAMLMLIVRTIYIFHDALDGSFGDAEAYKPRLKAMFENIAAEVKKTNPTVAEYQQRIFNIKLYGNLLGYISSSKSVRKLTKRLTLALAIPTYVYISSLCGFASYAIGRLAMIKWGLTDALLDSMFMPIAYTDLPHNHAIRLLGGLQVASLLFIGYDTIFRSIDQKMEFLSESARSLAAIFESEQIRNIVQTYDAKIEAEKISPVAADTIPT